MGIAVENDILDRIAAGLGLLELEHTEDVLVDSLEHIVLGIVVVLSRNGCETGEGKLTLFIEVQRDEVVVDLDSEQRHLGLDLGICEQNLGDAVTADHNAAQIDLQHIEHALVAVNDFIRAGGREYLDGAVCLIGIADDDVGYGIGFVDAECRSHLSTNHLHEVGLLIRLLDVQLLEDRHVGGDADDRFLVGHLVGAQDLVDLGREARDVTDMAVDDDLFLEVQSCRRADTDLAVVLSSLNDLDITVGNVKGKHLLFPPLIIISLDIRLCAAAAAAAHRASIGITNSRYGRWNRTEPGRTRRRRDR